MKIKSPNQEHWGDTRLHLCSCFLPLEKTKKKKKEDVDVTLDTNFW